MRLPVTLASVLRPKDSVSTRRLGEEMILLDLETGCYFGLNPVGTEVWERVQTGAVLGDIVAAVAAGYEVTRAECERDVLRLAGELLDADLVSLAGAESTPAGRGETPGV